MKRKLFFQFIVLAVSLVMMTSCNDMLKEDPKSSLVTTFFESEQGLEAELTGAYAGVRGLHAVGGNIGTDEFYVSAAVGGWERSPDTYDGLFDASNAMVANPWGTAFMYINSCNGIVQTAPDVEMDAARKTTMIAEAKFLRAQYYIALVNAYGAVPLDLGSGRLAYNTNPSTLSERDPIGEVYAVIIQDLLDAFAGLPVQPSQTGRGKKAAALYFLSKAYLTRGWSTAAQSDDFANAVKYADELLNNQATYGVALQEDYGLVHLEGHENDPEILFTAQHMHDYTFGGGHSSPWLFTAGYENVRINSIAVVPRSMEYQRPWRMYVTTPWLIWTAFADKTNDSRWDNSFRTVWKCGTTAFESQGLKLGDPGIVLYFEGDDLSGYPALAAKYKVEDLFNADKTYKSTAVEYMYPNLVKFDDTKRQAVNDMSYRPFIAARLAEVYLIAAEAELKRGNADKAAAYINVIRERAAYRPGLSAAELATAKTNMRITGADVDIDFILDERTRELCAEQSRWTELSRTKKLVERVRAHNPHGAPNVQERHMLRPIPQSQIDLMSDKEQKANYQNPGYN
jgi:hypothetical protein